VAIGKLKCEGGTLASIRRQQKNENEKRKKKKKKVNVLPWSALQNQRNVNNDGGCNVYPKRPLAQSYSF